MGFRGRTQQQLCQGTERQLIHAHRRPYVYQVNIIARSCAVPKVIFPPDPCRRRASASTRTADRREWAPERAAATGREIDGLSMRDEPACISERSDDPAFVSLRRSEPHEERLSFSSRWRNARALAFADMFAARRGPIQQQKGNHRRDLVRRLNPPERFAPHSRPAPHPS
jgi:hypothetical protein